MKNYVGVFPHIRTRCMVAIITSHTGALRRIPSDEPRQTAPNHQVLKQSCGARVWQNKCPSSRGPNDRRFCDCWGGSTYNFRKDSFTDYVETDQFSFYELQLPAPSRSAASLRPHLSRRARPVRPVLRSIPRNRPRWASRWSSRERSRVRSRFTLTAGWRDRSTCRAIA